MSSLLRLLLGCALAFGSFGAATFLSFKFEKRIPLTASGGAGDLIFLPSPQQARLMSLGYTNLVADYYWVKSLQYYMDPTQARNRYKNLGDFLDLVVGVDPDYEYAYKFAGLAVPFDTGRFRHVNTRRSTGFLERGAARFPQNWQFRFLLGFNYLNFHNEPTKAAEHFEAASKLPGSPAYLTAFTARVYVVGGDVDRALEFARRTVEVTTDKEILAMMKARVIELEVEKELLRIEDAAKKYKEAKGQWPNSIDELVAAGLEKPPPGYWLEAQGVAKSELNTDRMRLHQDENQSEFRGD